MTDKKPTPILEPDHLMGGDDEDAAVEAVVAASKPPEPPKADKLDPNDPKLQEEYTFEFSHEDGRGKIWKGKFTSVIPGVGTRAQINSLQANLLGGVPVDAHTDGSLNLAFVLSRLSFFLKKGKDAEGKGYRPDWAENLYSIKDERILLALWNEEVAQHEATFLGHED